MIISKGRLMAFYRKSYHTLIFIFTFLMIYVLLPKQGKFKYEFQKGSPWRHENLIAPFDFPILKSKEVYDTEKDSLLKQYAPYFNIDLSIGTASVASLDNDIENLSEYKSLNDLSAKKNIKNKFKDIYLEVYSKGVLDNSIETYEALKNSDKLNVLSDNYAALKNTGEVFTLKNAYIEIERKADEYSIANPSFKKIAEKIDLNKYLESNLKYDDGLSVTHFNEMDESLSKTRGVVPAGIRIISQGDIVSNENYQILESLKYAFEKNKSYGGWLSLNILGNMLIIFVLLIVLVLYLRNFNEKLFWRKRNFTLIFLTMLLMFVLARILYNDDYWSFYILPVCILPIIIRTFLGTKPSIPVHVITVLIIGFLAPNSFEYVLIQMVTGIVAVVSLYRLHRRGHLVISALYITLCYLILFFGFEFAKEGRIENVEWNQFRWFIGNGILMLITYPLIFIYEKVFGFISDVTLMELSDTNHPLLRKLAEEAPGTFQHSMQVANLAEAAVIRIGGNPMLVRTGALYHDVGKILNSNYFIENQMAGQNPHEHMSYEKSAEKIIDHVKEGITFANKHKIPAAIVDFIKTHHGTSMAGFFYTKYLKENPGGEIDIKNFSYPGPNPITKETAIVMLADGVEAASRSLPEKNAETLMNIVNRIIDGKINNRELEDAPLTFRDIKTIKEIFFEKLKNIYHVRIQYPK